MAQSDSERRELEETLNRELQEFIASRKPTPYTDGWSEENWEEEMQKHPMFMTEVPTDGKDLPPLVQAIQQLKYDPAENTAEELAENYKQDGNENFRLKKYRWAIDSYTTGLKQKCSNPKLNATLLTNRAAAHYHLENYRSAFQDAQAAIKLEPRHLKALVRGTLCCKQLKLFAECLEWCEISLKLDPGNRVLEELKVEATRLQKIAERDLRKKQTQEKKEKVAKERLCNLLSKRNVKFRSGSKNLFGVGEDGPDDTSHPALGKVHLDADGQGLVWPVIFIYPEYGQTDFVQEFYEDSRFEDHLSVMFGNDQEVDWDQEKKYKLETIQIYFEDLDEGHLIPVRTSQTLREVISQERFKVPGSWPTFQLLVKGSNFEEEWLKKFASSVAK